MEMREAFGRELARLGREFPNIFVLDADLCTSTMTHFFKEAYPLRFVQCGIAEQNMFSFAAGLATTGVIPFPTTFAVFASKKACDQISVSIAYPKLNVKIPGCNPGVPTGAGGATHQSVQDLANMCAMPHMHVVDPGDNQEMALVMRRAVEYYGPVYFRVTRSQVPDIYLKNKAKFEWGKAVTLKEGKDLALLGTGYMTSQCLLAAEILESQGLSVRVDHHPCLKPLDQELIIDAARKTGAIVTAENHNVSCGFGCLVAGVTAEHYPVPMMKIGVHDRFIESGKIPDLLKEYRMTPDDIAEVASSVFTRKIKRV